MNSKFRVRRRGGLGEKSLWPSKKKAIRWATLKHERNGGEWIVEKKRWFKDIRFPDAYRTVDRVGKISCNP